MLRTITKIAIIGKALIYGIVMQSFGKTPDVFGL